MGLWLCPGFLRFFFLQMFWYQGGLNSIAVCNLCNCFYIATFTLHDNYPELFGLKDLKMHRITSILLYSFFLISNETKKLQRYTFWSVTYDFRHAWKRWGIKNSSILAMEMPIPMFVKYVLNLQLQQLCLWSSWSKLILDHVESSCVWFDTPSYLFGHLSSACCMVFFFLLPLFLLSWIEPKFVYVVLCFQLLHSQCLAWVEEAGCVV